jgi:hypothetical protein
MSPTGVYVRSTQLSQQIKNWMDAPCAMLLEYPAKALKKT